MKKASIKDYELLIDYFKGTRTHCISTKYGLIELGKVTMDDFTDCVNEDNRLVMTNYEIDNYLKRLDAVKKVFDFTLYIHDFCEKEIMRFEKEIKSLSIRNDDETIN